MKKPRKKRTDTPYNKIIWSEEQLQFMKGNYQDFTNQELADQMGLKMTSVRTKLYSMGLYKMKLEYWTEEQVSFLLGNYKAMGDVELAEIFDSKWKKAKGWTRQHIEKKRRYLKLKRTPSEIKSIHQRNVDKGRFLVGTIKRWETTGQAKEGEIRMWREGKNGRMIPRVKINGKFIHWNRWCWEQHNGPIPEGMYVIYKGDPSIHHISNLKLVNGDDFHKNLNRSSIELTDGYIAGVLTHGQPDLRQEIIANHPEIIELKRNQLLLNREIRKQNDKI